MHAVQNARLVCSHQGTNSLQLCNVDVILLTSGSRFLQLNKQFVCLGDICVMETTCCDLGDLKLLKGTSSGDCVH
jgi:hypothetical protein